jgi:hypothetical protein
MKELAKIAITVLVVLVVYDMFIKKMIIKSSFESIDDELED